MKLDRVCWASWSLFHTSSWSSLAGSWRIPFPRWLASWHWLSAGSSAKDVHRGLWFLLQHLYIHAWACSQHRGWIQGRASQGKPENSMEFLWCNLQTYMLPLLPYAIGQCIPKGQLISGKKNIDFTMLWEKGWRPHWKNRMWSGRYCCGQLWKIQSLPPPLLFWHRQSNWVSALQV